MTKTRAGSAARESVVLLTVPLILRARGVHAQASPSGLAVICLSLPGYWFPFIAARQLLPDRCIRFIRSIFALLFQSYIAFISCRHKRCVAGHDRHRKLAHTGV